MPNSENIIGKGNRWKKGESGNPKGRPKKLPDLRESLVEIMGDEKKDKTALFAILARLRNDALNGNIRAAELLLRYAYPHGIESEAETDIEFVWGKMNVGKEHET
jgi:hypothetical protein